MEMGLVVILTLLMACLKVSVFAHGMSLSHVPCCNQFADYSQLEKTITMFFMSSVIFKRASASEQPVAFSYIVSAP